MSKKGKIFLVLGLVLILFVGGMVTFKSRENRIREANIEIEKLVEAEEYEKLAMLFNDFEKMSKNFGLTEEECYEIVDYFDMLQLYKEKDYDRVYSIAIDFEPQKCWIFKDDGEKFVEKFLNSKEGVAAKKKVEYEERLAKEIEDAREEIERWGKEHISEIAPYIGMPESMINNTMLGYKYSYENVGIDEKNSSYDYEKYYIWKDDKEKDICRVLVGQGMYDYEPEVKKVEFLGENWEKKSFYNGDDEELKKELTVGIYKGKLYKDRNTGSDYIENKSDEDMIEEYTDEYDVYEYSDADEFYYDHKDDFEGYEDAEQYYEDAWSFVE